MLSAFPPAGGIMGAMNDNEDITLLRAWARERSETASHYMSDETAEARSLPSGLRGRTTFAASELSATL